MNREYVFIIFSSTIYLYFISCAMIKVFLVLYLTFYRDKQCKTFIYKILCCFTPIWVKESKLIVFFCRIYL